MTNAASFKIIDLINSGDINTDDAKFIRERRQELDYFESLQSKWCPNEWTKLMLSAEASALAGFKERFGAERGRKLYAVIDY